MDIAEEIRVWGARHSESGYWGYSAYRQFINDLEWETITLNGEEVKLITKTETDEDYEGSIQAVFSVGDQVFAMDGSYSSWNGTEWNGAPYEVEAQPVTKIEYVRKR